MRKIAFVLASLSLIAACTNSGHDSPPESGDAEEPDTVAATVEKAVSTQPASTAGAGDDWPWYFGDSGGTHYSRLMQITRDNVSQLREVWRYETPEAGRVQTTPLVIDGTMYVVSAGQKVIALDGATGEQKWIYDSGNGTGAAVRGLTWWSDGEEGRLFSAVAHYIYAINPESGTVYAGFGDGGRIDLRANLRGAPDDNVYTATSPAVVYKDLLMLGGRVAEFYPASPGDYRAFDVRTGELRWAFHTIPLPGEPGAETWPEDARETQGGANPWAGSVVDTERGIVYFATGSPSEDFYGGDRQGDNLYGNSVVALNAETGEKLWHFQAIRHDLWDTDFAAPPVLLTVTRDGKRVDAVAATNKAGLVYLFDRVTGEPLFPIVETEFPATTVPGDVASPTQPIPTLPAPLNRQTLSRNDLTNRSPELREWAQAEYDTFVGAQQPLTPLTPGKTTLVIPGWRGGVEYGGITADPDKGIIYANTNNWVSLGTLVDADVYRQSGEGERIYREQCMGCHGAGLEGVPPAFPSLIDVDKRLSAEEIAAVINNGRGRMPGFSLLDDATVTNVISFIAHGEDSVEPGSRLRDRGGPTAKYIFTGYRSFFDPEGYPAWEPPWATLNAIDMNTGEYLWTVPFGEYKALAEQGLTGTGAENHGGSVLTASGVLFAGGTEEDQKFYAFDSSNGEILWVGMLPGFDRATPATYAVSGKQYVVISASPDRDADEEAPASYVVFALP